MAKRKKHAKKKFTRGEDILAMIFTEMRKMAKKPFKKSKKSKTKKKTTHKKKKAKYSR
jgi:hypothetical protein